MVWIWIVVALLAAIGELLSTGLFLACLSVAAIVAAGVAVVFAGAVALQVVVFAVASLVAIAVCRPVAVRALGWHPAAQIGSPEVHSHIINRRATVVRAVDASGGQIRIGEGEFWSARSFDPSDAMPVGTKVEVVLVDGVTALVAPVEQPALTAEQSLEKGT
jgi:membrane protein implicated in regulation of membrane protease activity